LRALIRPAKSTFWDEDLVFSLFAKKNIADLHSCLASRRSGAEGTHEHDVRRERAPRERRPSSAQGVVASMVRARREKKRGDVFSFLAK
jgi:hypothetical protein